MADLLRIVTLSKGGRPVAVKDLSYQQGSYTAERDSFKFTPAAPQQQTSRTGQRFGGATIVGETHDNAQAAWNAIITGTTPAIAATSVESMLAEIHAVARGRLLEWRPDGAAYSSFMRIAGPGVWDPTYRWAEWVGTNTLKVAISFPVDPLVEWAPMRILDDFAVDSTGDYTWSSTANIAVTGGVLVVTTTVARTALHTARGYGYQDVQVTQKVNMGGTLGAFSHRLLARASDLNNHLYAQISSTGVLSIGKTVAGTSTQLASTTAADVTLSVARWLRLRVEGDVVTAEWWLAEPTPTGTPSKTVSFTLASGEAQFRNVAGQIGVRYGAGSSDGTWTYDDLHASPYTSRNLTLPAVVQLGGAIPGDAPAKADVVVTLPTSPPTSAPWALIAWTSRPGTPVAGVAPFGIIEGESGGDLTGWVSTVNASSRGGNDLRDATVVGAETYTASYTIDPHTLVADDFTEGEIDLEVWARLVLSSGLVSPKFTISARPTPGNQYGAERFTHEYGNNGKLVAGPSSGTVYRFTRLGTVTLPVVPTEPSAWLLWVAASTVAGSSGVLGVDYLLVVPRRARALGPTGVANDPAGGYPVFAVSASLEVQRTIRSDLSGLAAQPPGNPYPHHGLGGSLIQLPPGNVDMLVKLSALVPDDPSVGAAGEQLAHTATVRVDVTPRSYLLRN